MRIFADDIDAIVLQMIKIRLFLLLLIAGTLQGFAQRRLVVVDVETLIPVVGANVISKDGNCTTDSLGYFSVSDSCKTLSFSHVNYESRLVRESSGESQRSARYSFHDLQIAEYQGSSCLWTWGAQRTSRCPEKAT